MWIARDKEGNLLFWDCDEKPVRVCDCTWACNNHRGVGYLDSSLFPKLKWEDEPLEVVLSIKRKPKVEHKIIKSTKELTPENIYYFEYGANPDYDEWVKAGIELEYGESEDDFDYDDFLMKRGDFDYTR